MSTLHRSTAQRSSTTAQRGAVVLRATHRRNNDDRQSPTAPARARGLPQSLRCAADNILTPTFKLKRADGKRLYQAAIDAIYERHDPVAGATHIMQGATTA